MRWDWLLHFVIAGLIYAVTRSGVFVLLLICGKELVDYEADLMDLWCGLAGALFSAWLLRHDRRQF